MKRGRPRDEYPHGEFRETVLATLSRRSFSLRALEALSGVNRGTLSAVLHGKRPCGRQDRDAIIHALGFEPSARARFVPITAASSGYDRILLDGRISANPQLRRGQELMSRAQFMEAYQEFKGVFDAAASNGDSLGQADAAGSLAWFHGELERFQDAQRWSGLSVGLIENHLGMSVDEVIDSVSPSQAMSGTASNAVHLLSRALRFRSKVLSRSESFIIWSSTGLRR